MNNLTTIHCIRFAKIVTIFTVGMLGLFVVFGNVTDYNANYQFVSHVMSMDSIKESMESSAIALAYRKITSPTIHTIGYLVVILTEAVITLLAFMGTYQMWKNRNADAQTFHKSKKYAILSTTACCLLWFLGFQVFAGEWFAMWMSNWNGLPDATRLVTYMFMVLIFISLKNDD